MYSATPPENITPSTRSSPPIGSVRYSLSIVGGEGSNVAVTRASAIYSATSSSLGGTRRHRPTSRNRPAPRGTGLQDRGERCAAGRRRPEADRRCARPPLPAPALVDQGELGGAAADVDVEDELAPIVGHPRGPRAVGSQQRLHVVAGRRADELAALVGEKVGDRFRIFPAQCFAGEDDCAAVDLVRMEARTLIGVVDDVAQRAIVDALLALIRRQCDRRLIQRLARHHEVAAGEVLSQAAQVQARFCSRRRFCWHGSRPAASRAPRSRMSRRRSCCSSPWSAPGRSRPGGSRPSACGPRRACSRSSASTSSRRG